MEAAAAPAAAAGAVEAAAAAAAMITVGGFFFFPVVDGGCALQSKSRSDRSGPSLFVVLPVPQNVGRFAPLCWAVWELDEHEEDLPDVAELLPAVLTEAEDEDSDEKGFCRRDLRDPTSLVAGEIDMAE